MPEEQRFCRAAFVLLLVGACAALPVPRSARAADMEAALSADREKVTPGETVRLMLTLRGDHLRRCTVRQPSLPPLRCFELISVSQRNEVEYRQGGARETVTFLYALKAGSPGEESISGLEARYRMEGEEEDRTIPVPGLTLAVGKRGRLFPLGISLAAIIAAGGAVSFGIWRKRRAEARRRLEPGICEARPRTADAATAALACLEEARRLGTAGDRGAYGEKLLAAMSRYAASEPSDEATAIVRVLEGLCERARYGGDEGAARGIEECARRAEVLLKGKVRKSLR